MAVMSCQAQSNNWGDSIEFRISSRESEREAAVEAAPKPATSWFSLGGLHLRQRVQQSPQTGNWPED
jgi:hypothetical protein